MTNEEFPQPRPSEPEDDEELLREVVHLADTRAACISAEEVEARLRMVFGQLQRHDGVPGEFAVVAGAPQMGSGVGAAEAVLVAAHLRAMEIVEVARREADARRREAHFAERHLVAVKEDAEKSTEAARLNVDIAREHALIILQAARDRANWLLESAAKARSETAGSPAELAAAGSTWESGRRRAGTGTRYERQSEPAPIRCAAVYRPTKMSPTSRPAPPDARHHRIRRQFSRYLLSVVAIDAVAASIAGAAAYLLRFAAPADSHLMVALTMPALWVAVVALLDGYEPRALGLGSEEYQKVLRAFVATTAVLGFLSYALKLEVARDSVVLALPLATLLTLLGRYGARRWLQRRRLHGHYLHRVIAVGPEPAVVDLVTQLRHDRYSGMQVVGACLTGGDGANLVSLGVPLLGDVDDVTSAVRQSDADTVAVAGGIDPTRLRRLSWELEGTDTDLVVSPGLIEVAGPRLHIRPVSGLPLLHVEEPQFSGARRVLKGAFDRVTAAVALFLAAPLVLGIAVAVRMSSAGPVIFRQTRVGRAGRAFTLYKFRTMYQDAELRRAERLARNERAEGLLFKMRDDPRITPVGRWLRRFSLDELPQLVNVVLGHMSLVGPRPPLPAEVALYEDDVRRRLLVKPGLTGLWQVSGRSDLTWEESVRLDLRYVENWSFALDLMILWKTGSAISKGRGAY